MMAIAAAIVIIVEYKHDMNLCYIIVTAHALTATTHGVSLILHVNTQRHQVLTISGSAGELTVKNDRDHYNCDVCHSTLPNACRL